jgi:hypothetical protein
MFTPITLVPRLAAATLAIAGLLLPAMASAQYAPPGQQPYGQPYPQPYGQPSYAQPQDETIHGRIYSINATFSITVTDDNGYMDNVELHQGTIINPTGLTLAPGMEVTIIGYSNGSVFEANEIDTPYTYSGPAPVPIYYGPGWWYPGYTYGYGPSFVFDFVFGGGGYRFERHDFDRHLFWAPRHDDRFRGGNGFAPRTAPRYNRNNGNWNGRNNGNANYSAPSHSWNGNPNGNANWNGRNNGNANYSAPSHTWNGNPNGNANWNGRNNGNANYSAPSHTWNGNPNGGRNNGNANYSPPSRTWNGNPNNNGNHNNGNANYSAPQSRPAYTRSTGSNESRNVSHSSDNGSRSDHSDRRTH